MHAIEARKPETSDHGTSAGSHVDSIAGNFLNVSDTFSHLLEKTPIDFSEGLESRDQVHSFFSTQIDSLRASASSFRTIRSCGGTLPAGQVEETLYRMVNSLVGQLLNFSRAVPAEDPRCPVIEDQLQELERLINEMISDGLIKRKAGKELISRIFPERPSKTWWQFWK